MQEPERGEQRVQSTVAISAPGSARTIATLQPDYGEVERMQRCKHLRFLPILILLLAASCTRDPKVQAQQALENANKFFAKAKYREAALMYKRALQKDMRFGEAYYRLALTELKLGNYGDAMREAAARGGVAAQQYRCAYEAGGSLFVGVDHAE